jgi:preprotein translocase subunit SecG
MYTFLLVLLVIDALILAAAVLMQAGKGGGVAANFGGASSATPSVIGSRQAGDLLTRVSWTAGGLFIFLAFVLQLMSSRAAAPRSILDDIAAPAPAQSQTAPSGDLPPSAIPLQQAPTTPPQP